MKNFDLETASIDMTIYKLRDTMLNLVNEIMGCYVHDDDSVETLSEVREIHNRLFESFKKLRDVIDMPFEERSDFIEEVRQIKKDVIKITAAADVYKDACSFMREYVINIFLPKVMDKYDDYEEYDEGIILVIRQFLDYLKSDDDSDMYLTIAKNRLMGSVPMRMPRKNFDDYAAESFLYTLSEKTKTEVGIMLRRAESAYFPIKRPEYGKYFPKITERVNSALKENAETISSDDAEGYYDDAAYCTEMLENAFDMLDVCYSITNYMLSIATFAVDSDFLFDDAFIVKDLFYSANNMLDKVGAADPEQITNLAVENIEEMYEKYYSAEKELDEYIENLTNEDIKNMDENTAVAAATYRSVDSAFKMELFFEMEGCYTYETDDEPMDKEELKNAVYDFINTLKEKIQDLPIKKQKFIKKTFLKNIYCPYSDDEILKYIKYSLEGITDTKEKGFVYSCIYEVFSDFHFKEIEE